MKKNSCTPINPRKYSCYGRKKIHSRNLTTKKKKSCGSKIPLPPPITFLMVRPLPTHIYIIQKLKNYHSLLHDKLEIDKAEWTKTKIHKTPLKPNYNIIQQLILKTLFFKHYGLLSTAGNPNHLLSLCSLSVIIEVKVLLRIHVPSLYEIIVIQCLIVSELAQRIVLFDKLSFLDTLQFTLQI